MSINRENRDAVVKAVMDGIELICMAQEMKENERILSETDIKKAEATLKKGDRVELIPVKDGVKVVRVRREEVKK